MARQKSSRCPARAGEAPRCQWCSAELPSDHETRCPSCGASLTETPETEIPGLTRVDHEAILRARVPPPKSRGIVGWLSGEYQEAPVAEPPGTFAPPAEDVRREMLRLELAALEAEVEARRAQIEAELADMDREGARQAAAAGPDAHPTGPPDEDTPPTA